MEKVRLSPTAVTLEAKCSLLFYLQTILKLPQKPGLGATLGTIAHLCLELLIKKRRKKTVEQVLAAKTIIGTSVEFLCRRQLNKHNIYSEENLDKLNGFILTGLKNDFYCEGADKVLIEQKIQIESDNWILSCRLDKIAIYPNKIKVIDLKSQKQKFSEEELQNNFQSQCYSLAIWEKYGIIPDVEFLLLKFVREPWQKVKRFTKTELKGLRHTLDTIAEHVRTYDHKKAHSNIAAHDPSRHFVCKYFCSYKNDFIYYSLVDDEGKTIKSSFDSSDLKTGAGQAIIKRRHNGCVYWKKLNESM